MSVTAVSSTQNNTPTAPIVSGPQTLGSDDFMKLLAVQFQSQDPLKPMDDTAFIAQMAQFTTLSQTQTMTTQMTKLSTNQELVAANSYIGQQVTVSDGNGGIATGIVNSVQVNSNGPQIMVGGTPYSISSVVSVQPGPVSSTTPAASTTSGGS
jgi:flagellar basal-body rod modification protein FlgD